MKRSITRPAIFLIGSLSLLGLAVTIMSSTNQPKWTATDDGDGIVLVKNQNGPTLGYSSKSGVKILTVDGLAFKDLNKNGKLDKYEDWRLPVSERAKDLASKLSVSILLMAVSILRK
jgi:beta-glucosidase